MSATTSSGPSSPSSLYSIQSFRDSSLDQRTSSSSEPVELHGSLLVENRVSSSATLSRLGSNHQPASTHHPMEPGISSHKHAQGQRHETSTMLARATCPSHVSEETLVQKYHELQKENHSLRKNIDTAARRADIISQSLNTERGYAKALRVQIERLQSSVDDAMAREVDVLEENHVLKLKLATCVKDADASDSDAPLSAPSSSPIMQCPESPLELHLMRMNSERATTYYNREMQLAQQKIVDLERGVQTHAPRCPPSPCPSNHTPDQDFDTRGCTPLATSEPGNDMVMRSPSPSSHVTLTTTRRKTPLRSAKRLPKPFAATSNNMNCSVSTAPEKSLKSSNSSSSLQDSIVEQILMRMHPLYKTADEV